MKLINMLSSAFRNTFVKRANFLNQTRFAFATANGDGISDPSNPKVFFKVSIAGQEVGDLKFEVSLIDSVRISLALCQRCAKDC